MDLDRSTRGFLPLESAVITKLLAGNHPALANLREQFETSSAGPRKWTGVGFFVDIAVPPTTPALPIAKRIDLMDIAAEIEGVEHGAGFVLFVDGGLLSFLEGYTFDEPWPEHVGVFELRYLRNDDRASVLDEIDEVMRA